MFRPGVSVFLMDGSGRPGATSADIEADFLSRIGSIARDGIGEDRLKRVKAHLIETEFARLQSRFERAKRIGLVATMGLPVQSFSEIADEIMDVRADWVRDTARHYLADDRRAVGVLQP